MEALKLMKKLIIIPLVLLFILAACPSLAQSLNNSTNETDSRDVFLSQESGSAGNESSGSIGAVQDASASAFNESEQVAVPNLSYIWSITGIEPGQVIMVLKQEGGNLYGQAKYEPDSGQSWNGVVIGSAEGNRIDLVLNSQNGTEETATRMLGDFDETTQSIKGDLIKVSNGQITERSRFEPYGSTRIYPAILRPLSRFQKPRQLHPSMRPRTPPHRSRQRTRFQPQPRRNPITMTYDRTPIES